MAKKKAKKAELKATVKVAEKPTSTFINRPTGLMPR